VEFVNGFNSTNTTGGLYVYDKSGNQEKFTDPVTFWCGSAGVNGQPLIGCVNGAETLHLTDTQVGFDPALGRWIATEMARDDSTGLANIYVAASLSVDARLLWEKWSEPLCTTDPTKPIADQPLLGWSEKLVAIDATCGDSTHLAGGDSLILIPNDTITFLAPSLPAPISAPCTGMAPARDEQLSFSNVYLLASIVPTTQNLTNCAPSSSNTEPYVVEYTATTSGVFGSNGCAAGSSGCSPVSVSPQWGEAGTYRMLPLAQQEIATAYQSVCATTGTACEIDLGDARITAAQIRVSNIPGTNSTNSPILATSFNTGILASGQGIPLSQNLWFIQSLGSGNSPGAWLEIFALSAGDQWTAYPTIAVDDDQEFYLGSTYYQAGIFPQTLWDSYTGLLSPTLLGQNVLETSASTYIGQAGTSLPLAAGPQRWGDYNTMIYDPFINGPGGEGDFWQVEEISKGGADESTTWNALADPTPLPYFMGATEAESECAGGAGSTCKVTVTAPAGVQDGDLLLVKLDLDQSASNAPALPDSGWSLLTASNISGSPKKITATCCSGAVFTSWLAAHTYTSGDSGSYTFKHYISVTGEEFGAFLVDYRAASTNPSSLVSDGFSQDGLHSTFKIGPVTPPGGTELVAMVFGNAGCETPESAEENSAAYAAPEGTPTLSPEAAGLWLAADAGVPGPPAQSYGSYTFEAGPAPGCTRTSVGPWTAWYVAIPEE
jgi:hypothetical protein